MDTLVNPVAVTVQGNSILMTLVTRPSRPDVSYASLPTPSTPFIIPAFAGMTGNRQPCHIDSMTLIHNPLRSAPAFPSRTPV